MCLFGNAPQFIQECKNHPLSQVTETSRKVRALLAEMFDHVPTTLKTWKLDTLLAIVQDITKDTPDDKIEKAVQLYSTDSTKRPNLIKLLARYPQKNRSAVVDRLNSKKSLLKDAADLTPKNLVPRGFLKYLKDAKKEFDTENHQIGRLDSICMATASLYSNEKVTPAQIALTMDNHGKNNRFGMLPGVNGDSAASKATETTLAPAIKMHALFIQNKVVTKPKLYDPLYCTF